MLTRKRTCSRWIKTSRALSKTQSSSLRPSMTLSSKEGLQMESASNSNSHSVAPLRISSLKSVDRITQRSKPARMVEAHKSHHLTVKMDTPGEAPDQIKRTLEALSTSSRDNLPLSTQSTISMKRPGSLSERCVKLTPKSVALKMTMKTETTI